MFRRVSIRSALFLGDLAVIVLATFIANWLRPQLSFGKPVGLIYLTELWPGWPIYVLAVAVWGAGFLLLDVYNLQKNLRLVDELQRLLAAHLATTLAFAGVLYFSFRDVSRLQVLSFAFASLLLLIGYRFVFRIFLHFFGDKRYGTRRVLIVGTGPIGHQVADMVIKNSWTGLKLVGFVDDDPQAITAGRYFGNLDQTLQVVQNERITEVIVALPREAHAKLANLVTVLQALKVNVRIVPDFFDLVFLRSVVEEFGEMPLITLREPVLDPWQRLVKRTFDLVMSTVGFIVALPVMAVIALAIKWDSTGPIIFRQQRVGENGRLFDMYKFRTMFHNTEEIKEEASEGHLIHKFYDDPRVTRVGRFLRRTSLDELPQLVNVLKGEMSLVGPRPELPWLVDRYASWQRKRFEVPQGLTGWWQVNGRANKLMHLHTEDDLYYIKNYSLWLDIKILWRTIKAVIERRGAY